MADPVVERLLGAIRGIREVEEETDPIKRAVRRRFSGSTEIVQPAHSASAGRSITGSSQGGSDVVSFPPAPPGNPVMEARDTRDPGPMMSAREGPPLGEGPPVSPEAMIRDVTSGPTGVQYAFHSIPTALREANIAQGTAEPRGSDTGSGGRADLQPGEAYLEWRDNPTESTYREYLREKGAPQWMIDYGAPAFELAEPGPSELAPFMGFVARAPWGRMLRKAAKAGTVPAHAVDVVESAASRGQGVDEFLRSVNETGSMMKEDFADRYVDPDRSMNSWAREGGIRDFLEQRADDPNFRDMVVVDVDPSQGGGTIWSQGSELDFGTETLPSGERAVHVNTLENARRFDQNSAKSTLPPVVSAFTDLADAHGVTMTTNPSAFGGGGPMTDDLAWNYNLIGFEDDPNVPGQMIRRPLPTDTKPRIAEAQARIDRFRGAHGSQKPGYTRIKRAKEAQGAATLPEEESAKVYGEWRQRNLSDETQRNRTGILNRLVPGNIFGDSSVPPIQRMQLLVDSEDSPFRYALEHEGDAAREIFRKDAFRLLGDIKSARRKPDADIGDLDRRIRELERRFAPVRDRSAAGRMGLEDAIGALDEYLQDLAMNQ